LLFKRREHLGKPKMLRDVDATVLPRMNVSSMPELSAIFGGDEPKTGVVPGSMVLFTAGPGFGKSTLMLMLADAMSEHGVLYNTSEETEKTLAQRARRLCIGSDFHVSSVRTVENLIDGVLVTGARIVIQDSISKLEDGAAGRVVLSSVLRKLDALREVTGVTVILIGHVTKAGSFAGPIALKHDVDVHIHGNIRSDDERILLVEKNRHGPATVEAKFSMRSGVPTFASSDPAQAICERLRLGARISATGDKEHRKILLDAVNMLSTEGLYVDRDNVGNIFVNRGNA